MKYVSLVFLIAALLIVILYSNPTLANVPRKPCNQEIYDHVYKDILQDVLNRYERTREELHQDMLERNDRILILRTLCRGQKSSYELTS